MKTVYSFLYPVTPNVNLSYLFSQLIIENENTVINFQLDIQLERFAEFHFSYNLSSFTIEETGMLFSALP
jgi:hypothetical protein